MKILITGVAGFIGNSLAKYLETDERYVISGLDKRLNRFNVCDILEYSNLEKVFTSENPTIVIHLAARTDLGGKSLEDYNENILGTSNVLRAARMFGVKKVIVASSMLVNPYVYSTQSNLQPTVYGLSKLKMEELIHDEYQDMNISVIRITSAWGPGFDHPYKDFFQRIYQQRYFNIVGQKTTKTFIFIDNLNIIFKRLLTDSSKKTFYACDDHIEISSWANKINSFYRKSNCFELPYYLAKGLALFGDVIVKIGFSFPMTSYRLNNLTKDNIIDLTTSLELLGLDRINLEEATKKTIKYLNENAIYSVQS